MLGMPPRVTVSGESISKLVVAVTIHAWLYGAASGTSSCFLLRLMLVEGAAAWGYCRERDLK